jgi:glycosyltransferase involved in cell wall biosynthesis
MKVLIMTAMYPTPERPFYGTFVRTQVESLRRAGVTVEVLFLHGRSHKLMYPRAVAQMHRLLRDESVSLVHAHFGLVGMVARMQWRVPVVVTFHGDDLLGTRNREGQITRASKLIVVADQVLAECVDAVIVQSRQMANKLKRGDTYIIPHEVDLDVFVPHDRDRARLALGLDASKKYLLFAADPGIEVKRFPLAQAAAEKLCRHDPSVELLVVCKEPQDRLSLYMSACDALVFPSYQEGSPNVVKQAMACNLPIVSTDVGDIRETIGATEGCYVCMPDADEIAARLTAILSGCRRTSGRDGVQHLACPLVAQRIINVYEEILRKKRSTSHKAALPIM